MYYKLKNNGEQGLKPDLSNDDGALIREFEPIKVKKVKK